MKIVEQDEHVVEVSVVVERRDGSRYRATLKGDDARRWDRYTDVLTDVARDAGAYPPFHALRWDSADKILPFGARVPQFDRRITDAGHKT